MLYEYLVGKVNMFYYGNIYNLYSIDCGSEIAVIIWESSCHINVNYFVPDSLWHCVSLNLGILKTDMTHLTTVWIKYAVLKTQHIIHGS